MTSIKTDYVWTPQAIQMDKELKEKYGPQAHVIPQRELGLPKSQSDMFVRTTNNDEPTYETNVTWVKGALVGIVNDKVLDLKKNKEESSFFNQVYQGVLASDNNGSMLKQNVNIKFKSFGKVEGNVGNDEFNLRVIPAILSGGLKFHGTVNGEEVNFNIRNVTKEEWDKHPDIYATLAGVHGFKVDFDDNGKAVCSVTRTKRENIQKQAVMQQVQNQQAQLMNDQINQINQQIQMNQMNQLAVNNANMMTFGHI